MLQRVLCFAVVSTLAAHLGAASASAQCDGDCDDSATVDIGEVMTSANIYLSRTALAVCPNADSDGNGEVRLFEVVRSARSFMFGCPTQPPTPTPTPTSTNTPVPPTATSTPVPPTATATVPPTATATPTTSLACGNGLLEKGETCSSCAADCEIQGCTPSGQTATFLAFFSAGTEVTAVSLDLNYRSDLVQLPGTANASTVRARITGLPAGGQSIINDRDYGVRIVKSRTEPLPEGQLFQVEFDRCSGAAAPTVADLACVISSCSDEFSLPVSSCACDIVTP